VLGALLALSRCAFAAEAPNVPVLITGGTEPADIVPIERTNPDYPDRALSRQIGGWVHLSFGIAPDGTTEEVIALNSSDPVFERSAVEAVSQWRYEVPATGPAAKGGAIESVIAFSLYGNIAPSGFMREFRPIESLLNEQKLDEAEALLPDARRRIRTVVDVALYHWLAFRIALAHGDKVLAADELEMMSPAFKELSNDIVLPAVEMQIALAVENGKLEDAQDYVDWAQANDSLESHAGYAPFMQRLAGTEQDLAVRRMSPEPISVAATHFRKYWTHALTHHEFALGNVEGELNSVQVRCSNTRVQHVDVLIDSGYKLPDAWEDCLVIVEADAGTRYVLTEFPPEPATPQ
jgi:TonB family protein